MKLVISLDKFLHQNDKYESKKKCGSYKYCCTHCIQNGFPLLEKTDNYSNLTKIGISTKLLINNITRIKFLHKFRKVKYLFSLSYIVRI